MGNMQEMQDKFLMLAWKLGIDSTILNQISEWFKKMNETSVMNTEKWQEWKEIDITKKSESPLPSEDEIDKMTKEELAILVKTKIRNPEMKDEWVMTWQKETPFVVMMKKQWF